MSGEQQPSTFWQRVRWDGCAPLFVLGSRGVLALFFGPMGSVAIGSLLISPTVALARAHIANKQLAALGTRRTYLRQICIATAIIVMMVFEIVAMMMWVERTTPLWAWSIPAGLYLLYLAMIMIALRPVTPTKAADPHADYWTVQRLDR